MIYEVLSEGAENALTGKQLCNMLKLSPRVLTATVERERRDGKPICASASAPHGYFLAANQAEMQKYCRSLLHRAGELHKTRKACIETMKDLPEE